MYLATLQTVMLGDWLIKASSFDDQILVFFHNERIISTHIKMFYDEEVAHDYIERFLNDKVYQTNNR
jgi:hypothetical protein